MAAFPASPAPSYGTGPGATASVDEAPFGDGYTQRSAPGLNAVRRTMPMTWSIISDADATAFDAFLEAMGGHQAFEYTLPHEANARLWTCKEWRRDYVGFGFSSFTATFREEFL